MCVYAHAFVYPPRPAYLSNQQMHVCFLSVILSFYQGVGTDRMLFDCVLFSSFLSINDLSIKLLRKGFALHNTYLSKERGSSEGLALRYRD